MSIPNDSSIRAAWLKFASYLGDPDHWQKSGAIEDWQCAALIADMIETGLNTPCETESVGGAMQFIEQQIIASTNLITFAIPAGDWRLIRIIGKVTAIGTTERDLLLALGGDGAANRYTTTRTTTVPTAVSGTGQTDNAIWPAVTSQNMLAAENSDPPYSQLEFTAFDPLDTGKTLFSGSLHDVNDDRFTVFRGKHNIAQADNSIQVFASDGVNIKCDLSMFGVLKNAE